MQTIVLITINVDKYISPKMRPKLQVKRANNTMYLKQKKKYGGPSW